MINKDLNECLNIYRKSLGNRNLNNCVSIFSMPSSASAVSGFVD